MADFAKNITDKCIVPKTCRERFLPVQAGGNGNDSLLESGIFFSGVSELVPGYSISRKKAPFHLVIFGVGGNGQFQCPGNDSSIQPGDIWICPENTPHQYRADGNWKILFFHIDPEKCPFGDVFQTVRLGLSRSSAQLENAMIWLINENQQKGIHSPELSAHYSSIIRLCLEREIQSVISPEMTRNFNRLDGLWQEVSESLAMPWSLNDLAQRMHLSNAQLRRIVQAHHHMAPMEMVQHLRIQKAQQLLKTTDDSLDHIAERVGYLSPFSFSRAFKKCLGISPRDYRTKARSNPYLPNS